MRSIAPAALLLIALAAPASAITIQGRVLNGADRAPVSGVGVELHAVRGDQEEPGGVFHTDARGSYRFTGLAADPGLAYYISLEYRRAIYTEGPLASSGGDVIQRDLLVYEVGRDIASVRVKNHHIVVERKSDGLHIHEILVFENTGTTAYLGTGLNHAENAGIRLGLPASVEDFQPGVGGDPQTMRVQGRDLTGQRPIPPGVRPFSFTYRVPLSGRMDLSHRLYFPTQDFVILIDDPKLALRTSSLASEGIREQGGRPFAIYRGRDFKVGQEITMRVEGAPFWSNPSVYPWLAAPFLIAGALVYAARRGRRARQIAHAVAAARPGAHGVPAAREVGYAPATHAAEPRPVAPRGPEPPPAAPRAGAHAVSTRSSGNGSEDLEAVYLYLISALDQANERGEIPHEGYALVRQNLKRRLKIIMGDSGIADAR